MTRYRLLAALLTLCLPGCSRDDPNPLTDPQTTRPISASAAIVFSSDLYAQSPAPRELFSIEESGAGVTQLTFCNGGEQPCDTIEASIAPDRQRSVARRVRQDTNRDGQLGEADGEEVLYMDLSRSVEAQLLPPAADASGIDWSAVGEVVVFSAVGNGTRDDLYRMDPNGQNNRNLTSTADVHERRARIDPTGNVAVYERIDASGKGRIYIFLDNLRQVPVTAGGPGSDPLPGTPYVVGSDADPDYSPDGNSIVFRRLTGLGNGGLGAWDVLTVRADGTGLQTIATGASYRGAPDWGPRGIVFAEAEAAQTRLVVMQPDGSGRRVLLTRPAGFRISYPRWIP